MIRAILIDIGGVLWHPKEIPLSVNWAGRCRLSPKEFDEIVYNSEWGSQALVGMFTSEEMWKRSEISLDCRLLKEFNARKSIGQEYGILSFWSIAAC